MTYVVTDACTKDENCVAVCPVDCIRTTEDAPMMYVDPDECIDCGACVAECEYSAIMAAEDLPVEKQQFIQINAAFFSRS
jgi:NAD-dependent dihydropyrimidine dehydrogenase PreA subunit